jgi:hypothetical protein
MKHSIRFMSVLAIAATVGSASVAWAGDEAVAKRNFQEGLGLYNRAQYSEALEKFRKAYDESGAVGILANIGTAAWKLGRNLEAADAYDRYLAAVPPDDPTRPEVEKALADVVTHLAKLEVVVAGGDATVTLDGKPVEANRLSSLRVEPGRHVLRAEPASGPAAERTVEASAGQTSRVELKLTTEEAPAAPPRPPPPTTTGKAELETPGGPGALPWIITGVGAAGLVASGVFFAMKSSSVSKLEDECIDGTCHPNSQPTIDNANTFGTVSLVALGVGIVGLGTGIYMLASGTEKKETSGPAGVRFAVDIGQKGGGASLRGAF